MFVFGINNPVRWVDPSGLFIIPAMVTTTTFIGPLNALFPTIPLGSHGTLGNMPSLGLVGTPITRPTVSTTPAGTGGIVLSPLATQSQIQSFNRAIAYLKTSDTARKLIETLQSSTVTTMITFYSGLGNRAQTHRVERCPTTGVYFSIINWNPNAGLRFGRDVMSPAMALAHEMGHVLQFQQGMFDYHTNMTRALRNELESDNMNRFEFKIAYELNEPPRAHHNHGVLFRVPTSTCWGETYNPRSYWNPFRIFTGHSGFRNLNPWQP